MSMFSDIRDGGRTSAAFDRQREGDSAATTGDTGVPAPHARVHRALCAAPPPVARCASVRGAVMERIRETRPVARQSRARLWVPVAAAAVLAFGAGVWIGLFGRGPAPVRPMQQGGAIADAGVPAATVNPSVISQIPAQSARVESVLTASYVQEAEALRADTQRAAAALMSKLPIRGVGDGGAGDLPR